MGDSAKKENDSIRFDSVPQTSRFDSIHCKPESTASTEAEGNAPCQNPHPQFTPGVLKSRLWTVVLKLLDQCTEAMTGWPTLQQTAGPVH